MWDPLKPFQKRFRNREAGERRAGKPRCGGSNFRLRVPVKRWGGCLLFFSGQRGQDCFFGLQPGQVAHPAARTACPMWAKYSSGVCAFPRGFFALAASSAGVAPSKNASSQASQSTSFVFSPALDVQQDLGHHAQVGLVGVAHGCRQLPARITRWHQAKSRDFPRTQRPSWVAMPSISRLIRRGVSQAAAERR